VHYLISIDAHAHREAETKLAGLLATTIRWVGTAWPLTGRDEELRRINAALTGEGAYAGVVVAGDPGVGKSRLARDALALIPGRYGVRWVVATASARPLPLGVFAEWVSDVGTDPMTLVRDLIQSLTANTKGGPVVVGVDDAHLLDGLSAFVLHQLVQRRLAKVIVTVRNRETAPDAVTSLWKDSYLERLELQPLSQDESDSLLSGTLGGPLDPATAQQLWNLTRGNVLFLRHLVEQEVASHRLRDDAGLWSWSGEPTASNTLAELIETQMGALPEPLGEVLDLVAVGEPLDSEVLAAMVGADAVEEAETQGLITVDEGPNSVARVAHPLYGEMRRARGGALRLRRLRGQIVLALADTPMRDARDLIYRALLTLDSDLPADGALFTQAAGAAMQLFDPALTEKLAGAGRRAEETYEAIAIHTFALHLTGQASECERVLADAEIGPLTPEYQTNIAVHRAGNLLWGLGSPAEANRVLDAASTQSSTTPSLTLEGFRAVFEAANGHAQTAIDAAYAVASSVDAGFTAMMADFALVIALGHAGRVREVADAAAHGYALAASSVEAAPLVFGLNEFHVESLILGGYQSDAEAETERWARQTAEIPAVHGAYAASIIGRAELSAGRVRNATEWLEKGMRGFRRFANAKYGAVGICRSDLVIALSLSRNRVAASDVLKTLNADSKPFGFMDSRCILAEAWVSAAEGMVTDAVAKCRRAADAARHRGHFALEVRCLQTATRFGDHTTAPRLADLCAVVDGPRVKSAAAHAAALAADDTDGLIAASEQLEQMGDMLSAADAAAHAAAAYRRRNQRGSALMARERVQRLAELCDRPDTPALREAKESKPLTPRQREIFALVAQGFSNKQIAERLNMSVRTVEGHRFRADK
jgi:DNA-binding CsgD family transcriptional regulator